MCPWIMRCLGWSDLVYFRSTPHHVMVIRDKVIYKRFTGNACMSSRWRHLYCINNVLLILVIPGLVNF